MTVARSSLACALALALLPACESIADLTVRYVDAGDTSADASDASLHGDVTLDADDTRADASSRTDTGVPQPLGPCPCDTSASIGCCIPSGGASPFCLATAQAPSCTASGGMFVGCTHNDVTDSVCCWRSGTGAGSQTSYAASCNADPTACEKASDCAGGSSCATIACGPSGSAFTVGVCRATPPACP